MGRTEAYSLSEPVTPVGAPAPVDAVPVGIGRRYESLYFALRNRKFLIGAGVVTSLLVLALVGPALTDADPLAFEAIPSEPPSSEHWFGTTASGQDVFAQFVHGLRASFIVGVLGGGIAALLGMLVGFTAGYRGGIVDDLLSLVTNVVLVIPTLALLIVFAAFNEGAGGFVTEGIFIGLTSGPGRQGRCGPRRSRSWPVTSSTSRG